ncbi:MAG: hypothetical protein IPH30_03510 [Betaproteobacteria bacterium]|nr:hypothetical protein [Betaproteobacteria bacterium]
MKANCTWPHDARMAINLVALLGLAALSACAISYSALPISARVVDADSNEPLAEVIVVVKWEFEYIPGISEHRGSGTFGSPKP